MGDFTKAQVVADVRTIVGNFSILGVDNALSDDQINLSIDQAVVSYSWDLPRMLTAVVQGVADQVYYDLSGDDGLANWRNEFSAIRQIDFNCGENGRAAVTADSDISPYPRLLASVEYEQVRLGDTDYLTFTRRRGTPDEDRYFEVYYTVPHMLVAAVEADPDATPPVEAVAAVNTLPEHHRYALEYLTVAKMMQVAAIRVAKSSDPTSGAQFMTFTRDKVKQFRDIANEYMRMYRDEIGGDRPRAASIIVDAPLTGTFGRFYAHRSGGGGYEDPERWW